MLSSGYPKSLNFCFASVKFFTTSSTLLFPSYLKSIGFFLCKIFLASPSTHLIKQ